MYKMAILSKIKSHSDVKNIDQIAKQLIVIKTDQAFKGYAMSYKVKIVEKKKRFNCTIRSK